MPKRIRPGEAAALIGLVVLVAAVAWWAWTRPAMVSSPERIPVEVTADAVVVQ